MEQIDILDWFDVNNIEHIRAYKYLMDNGFWEEGFIPDHVVKYSNWNILLMNKMVNAYVENMIGGN